MRRAFTLLTLIALVACHDETVTPLVDRIEGVYTLQTVDGASLPIRTTTGNAAADLNSGRLSLSITGNFMIEKVGTLQVGTAAPYTTMERLAGTFREDGNTLTLSTPYPPTLITATHASATITYSDNGKAYVWRRE